jgi:hypothetical protein
MRGLIILVIVGILSSCSSENDDFMAIEKSTNNQNGKSIYENYLNSNMSTRIVLADFANLSKADKIDVWLYKYELYKTTNNLSAAQVLIVDDLIRFVQQDAFELNLDETLIDNLERDAAFEFSDAELPYLFNTLENNDGDFMNGGVVADGCFWCYQISNPGPCTATYNDQGGFTGFSFSATVTTRRFWVNISSETWDNIPCTFADWADDGYL